LFYVLGVLVILNYVYVGSYCWF